MQYVLVLQGISLTVVGPFASKAEAERYRDEHYPKQGRVYALKAS